MRLREKFSKKKEEFKRQKKQNEFLPSGPLILLEGKGKAVLYDCRRILCYAPTDLLLLCKKDRIKISGEDLYCAAFSCGTLTVRGRIDSVVFLTEEGR